MLFRRLRGADGWLDTKLHTTVMVGEGRPSTSFFFSPPAKNKEIRGCSPEPVLGPAFGRTRGPSMTIYERV
jgi:hypothetical protein